MKKIDQRELENIRLVSSFKASFTSSFASVFKYTVAAESCIKKNAVREISVNGYGLNLI